MHYIIITQITKFVKNVKIIVWNVKYNKIIFKYVIDVHKNMC